MTSIQISIGGETYPAILSTHALAGLEQKTGKGFMQFLNELQVNGKITDYVTLLFFALKGGCKREKKPFTITEEQLIDLIDENEISIFDVVLEIVTSSMPAAKGDAGNLPAATSI